MWRERPVTGAEATGTPLMAAHAVDPLGLTPIALACQTPLLVRPGDVTPEAEIPGLPVEGVELPEQAG